MNLLLKKMIDSSDVISFDIFDTLIKRNIFNNEDIYTFTENRYNKIYDNKISNFRINRINAENKARIKYPNKDITLNDIYTCFEQYTKKELDILKKIEIDTEIDFSTANEEMYNVYSYCKSKNKKIICISDMYLPGKVIYKILKKNNYNVDKIFVSCEINKSKYLGTIYKYVLDNLGIKASSMVHIGDALRADFINALKNGVCAYHIKRYKKNYKYINIRKEKQYGIDEKLILSIINNNVGKFENSYEKLGFEILGPVCCSFANWIKDIGEENNVNNYLFCARDMKLTLEIFNLLFGSNNTYYFYTSRKSTYLPYLYFNNTYDGLKKILSVESKIKKITIGEILYNCNITNINNIKQLLCDYELNIDQKYKVADLLENENFNRFYDEVLKEYIQKYGLEQYDNLKKYLLSLNFSQNSALVDLGWNGTTQSLICDMYNKNCLGLYFGLFSKKSNNSNSRNAYAYCFEGKNSKYGNMIFSFRPLLEKIFSAQHSSTIGYKDDPDKRYILDDKNVNINEEIESIQKGALEFTKILKVYIDNQYIEKINTNIFLDYLLKIGISPTYEQAKKLGKIYCDGYLLKQFATPQNIFFYMLNISRLKKDFGESEWKVGFMKILFKINLPYYKIYDYFRIKRDDKK